MSASKEELEEKLIQKYQHALNYREEQIEKIREKIREHVRKQQQKNFLDSLKNMFVFQSIIIQLF